MRSPVEAFRAWVPRWWRGGSGPGGAALGLLLAPAEAVYGAVVSARNSAYDSGWLPAERASIPVVSVGNIGVGGAGKTPVAAWLAGRLAAAGRRPAIVLRGYGADEIAVHRELNPDVPVVAAVRRAAGVQSAADKGCDIAVLDDAFQHRSVMRDADVVLVAAESWSATRRLLPRGPWREPVGALRRADLVIVTRKSLSAPDASRVADALRREVPGIPVAVCHLRPTGLLAAGGEAVGLSWLARRRVLAVTSLADPDTFVRQLAAAGAEPELLAFPDHHEFDQADLARIRTAAAGRPVVCTRKEAVKLSRFPPDALSILVLDQEIVPEEAADAIEMVIERLLER